MGGSERLTADDELFRLIKDGDAEALKVLFKRYYAPLCRFSASIVKNDESAEEVVSDMFVDLWLKRAAIEIRAGVRQYLYGAVRNRSLNVLRSYGIPTKQFDHDEEDLTSPEFNADRPLLYKELERSIDAFINRMPERRRLIFRMHRIDGLTYQEIAEILSLSIHTVQNQMVEAVKFLYRCAKLHR